MAKPGAKHLKESADIIEQVMKTLDSEQITCSTCRCDRWRNWKEHNAHEQLDGIIQKLRKLASSAVFSKE